MKKDEKRVRDFIERVNKGGKISYPKAIRMNCLDCTGFQPSEVRKCTMKETCPLWHLRFGRNPTSGKTKRKKFRR